MIKICVYMSSKVPGAVKIGKQWGIPDDESEPVDARIKSGKYI